MRYSFSRLFDSTCISLVLMFLLTASHPVIGQDTRMPGMFDYDYTTENELAKRLDLDHPDPAVMKLIFAKRRNRVLQAIPRGAMLIYSVEQAQPRRLEFQVAHSENHDFIYLTGLEGLQSLDSAILLLPTPEKYWVVLYTSANIEQISEITGIDDVRSFEQLEIDLSASMTDYRDWRITQIVRSPLQAALSKAWGRHEKTLYLNYPRFLRLDMPEPGRIDIFARLQRFSPEMDVRDSADILDLIRMRHDAYALASLRRAVSITREGTVEGLRAVRPGRTEKQIMEITDFVYRYHGAYLGFPTAVRNGRSTMPKIPEGYIAFVPRSTDAVFADGDLVHIDTGASFNHHSADIQRIVPVNGIFTSEQRRLYEIVLNVQKTVIEHIKPGVRWWELHNLAVDMLREAGGYDQYYTYGIGHFIGMEVHDEGDYEQPLQPGMALTIEQGTNPPGGQRVALEDDVIVTETGYEWISRSIPIELVEVEEMVTHQSTFEAFIEMDRLP